MKSTSKAKESKSSTAPPELDLAEEVEEASESSDLKEESPK